MDTVTSKFLIFVPKMTLPSFASLPQYHEEFAALKDQATDERVVADRGL